MWVVPTDTLVLPQSDDPYIVPCMKTWMRRRGDRVKITTGKYAGHTGTVESNVYQRTVDYPEEWANGHHILLDTEEFVTVRGEQVDCRLDVSIPHSR